MLHWSMSGIDALQLLWTMLYPMNCDMDVNLELGLICSLSDYVLCTFLHSLPYLDASALCGTLFIFILTQFIVGVPQ